ncbi:organoarsenical effux MFS transporter ArsJ [Shewanella sp. 10N.286.54.B9]|uniref:organoarsenical effux MFS transporter ArsJ n=1 Tax=Shewanella sp. 10N.286.54.B9 TaxID=3229719 RepID=UPI00354F5900
MLAKYRALPESIRQYLIVTANYWAFTLTDGALRMLVVLHFYDLGYTPLAIAMLFLFYEIFGVITNLVGGWLGARLGLNRTMNIGLGLQIAALAMLLLPAAMLTVPWVMAAQALSGIAKDLNKMSAKSAIKTLVPKDAEDKLYRWVAMLTGSKNALKGAGFFLGGVLLSVAGFTGAIAIMAAALLLVWLGSLVSLKADLGKAKSKPKFTEIFSKSDKVNILSAARLFLFAARDVWFVIALPVFLASQLGWDHSSVGAFLALWVIAYGMVQSIAPSLTARKTIPDGRVATIWAGLLALITALLTLAIYTSWVAPQVALIIGLLVFGVVFAINSSLHSYLIVSYAGDDGVSLDIGFYYMANAMGRLIGTILSGWVYQVAGLGACLAISTALLLLTWLISFKLPRR